MHDHYRIGRSHGGRLSAISGLRPGHCPVGITTQDPRLRARLFIDVSAWKQHFLRVSTDELRVFARMTANDDVPKLSVKDLCTVNSENPVIPASSTPDGVIGDPGESMFGGMYDQVDLHGKLLSGFPTD